MAFLYWYNFVYSDIPFEQPDAISMLIITWMVIILFAYWIVFFFCGAGFVSIPALGYFQ